MAALAAATAGTAAITIDSPRWRDGWGEPLLPASPAAPALRLVPPTRRPGPDVYRRRRLAAVVLAGLVLAVALAIGAAMLARPATAGSLPEGRRTVLVEPGDTYWSIAEGIHERGDLRVTVDALIEANGARALFPGDRIELP